MEPTKFKVGDTLVRTVRNNVVIVLVYGVSDDVIKYTVLKVLEGREFKEGDTDGFFLPVNNGKVCTLDYYEVHKDIIETIGE